jgi:hypothetical protein
LVAKLDVLELDSIKKRLKMVFKIWKCWCTVYNAGWREKKKLYDSLTPMLLDFRCYQNRFAF